MATKINNSEYDAPLEVRTLRHTAELAIIHEMDHSTIYATVVYTDDSEIGDSVGAAGIIFVNGKMVHQLKFKLHGHCTNNQAEQIAIFKVLEKIIRTSGWQDNEKSVAIYTDNKIYFDLLHNKFKRNRLIELIRNKIIALMHLNSTVHFGWVKRQAGIEGSDLVHRLTEEAAVEEGQVT